jgi:hypothetical protein
MGFKENLGAGFRSLVSKTGRPVQVTYFTRSTGSVWDDDITLTQSSTIFVSGIVLPLNSSADGYLVEQGILNNNDLKVYFHGSINFAGSARSIEIRIGSNAGETYSMLPEPVKLYEAQDTPIYKKVYIRRLTTGSLIGM